MRPTTRRTPWACGASPCHCVTAGPHRMRSARQYRPHDSLRSASGTSSMRCAPWETKFLAWSVHWPTVTNGLRRREIDLNTPVIRDMTVIPVAGHDSMLLNLSGAHGPFFTRNLVIVTDSDGRTGVGEVPGGEPIRQTLDDARALVTGRRVADYNAVLNNM